jgi:hypothetical protein
LDGKEPRQGGGHSVLTAVTVPSPHYLGNAIVDTKTNEIPGARQLFKKLGRDGRKVSLDALHTQTQTARQLVLEPGADFLLTVKDHQPTLRANIEKPVTAPPAGFPPRSTTPTLAGKREFSKGQPESRVLRSQAATAEQGDFPSVEHIALLRRQLRLHSPETGALVTSLAPQGLDAAQWRQYNRAA